MLTVCLLPFYLTARFRFLYADFFLDTLAAFLHGFIYVAAFTMNYYAKRTGT